MTDTSKVTDLSKLVEQIKNLKESIGQSDIHDVGLINDLDKVKKKITEFMENNQKTDKIKSIKEMQQQIAVLITRKRTMDLEITDIQKKILSECKHWEVTRNNDFDGHNTYRYYSCNTCGHEMSSIDSSSKVVDNVYSG